MPKPLRYRELLAHLKDFGVIEKRYGAGSRRVLYKENVEGQTVFYYIHPHSEHHEFDIGVVNSTLRRFKINPKEFWKEV